MFTRSRPGGNQNYGSGRPNMNPQNHFVPGNNSHIQQANYAQPQFKPTMPLNESFKPGPVQQPPQQQPIVQNSPQKSILRSPGAPPSNPSTSGAPAMAVDAETLLNTLKDEPMADPSDVPRWKRKIPGVKVNRKLKRRRMNQRLRKTLMPKNAIMVLNEMKAGVQFIFPETQPIPNGVFLVHATLDGKTYVGQGLSKLLARQNAAENALKSLLLEKMTAAAMKEKADEDSEAAETVPRVEGDCAEGSPMDTSSIDDADDVPWSSLASFALHKLFLEWQNSGTVVPIPRSGLQSPVKPRAEPKAPVDKELPANADSIHPVMLLNQMRPGTTYVEVSRVGNPPNTLFTLAVELDGKGFTGEAKNKKDAKKFAAKAALEALYGLKYSAETPDELNIKPPIVVIDEDVK